MARKHSNKYGWLIVIGGFISIWLLFVSVSLAVLLVFVIGLFITLDRSWSKTKGIFQKSALIIGIMVPVAGIVSIVIAVSYFTNLHKKEAISEVKPEEKKPVRIVLDTTDQWIPGRDTAALEEKWIIHDHEWKDLSNHAYKAALKVRDVDFKSTAALRENSYIDYTGDDVAYWESVYTMLYHLDKDKLNEVYAMFQRLSKKYELNRIETAELVVSCIQHIPYHLVLTDECEADLYKGQYAETALNNGVPCVPNVKYGVHSPVEFVATMKGDCDTRTMLLYTILSKLKYDVVILGSTLYAHSILGVNLPVSGKFKKHKGIKYFVWETTATDYKPGMLPPLIADMDNWDVDLSTVINK